MFVFPEMIAAAAEQAGIPVPNPKEMRDYSAESGVSNKRRKELCDKYPQFHVFCNVQLCRPMVHFGEHWDNAKIVAAIPLDKLRTTTLQELLDKGLSYASG